MNINKFTIKSRSHSFRNNWHKPGQQQIENEHIFKAFEVDENVAPLF
jgi:hypothetical protein